MTFSFLAFYQQQKGQSHVQDTAKNNLSLLSSPLMNVILFSSFFFANEYRQAQSLVSSFIIL